MSKQVNKRPADAAWASFHLTKRQGDAVIRIAVASLAVSVLALVFAALAYFFPK